jgi:hypothetical protein
MRLRLLRIGLTVLAVIGARPALAGPITLTGNVENDFVRGAPNVNVVNVLANPAQVGEAGFITQSGSVSGWAIKDIRTSYDASSDTMSVGFNTFRNAQGQPAIVGDSDGNGDPGGASSQMKAAGGVDTPHLGGHKSVAIAFASDAPNGQPGPGKPLVIAGIPSNKATQGPGLDGFNVAQYKGLNLGLGDNFGPTLTSNLGTLAFDPSKDHPGLEFTIKNFSKIPGLSPTKGLWVTAYAGSPDDVVAGEAGLKFTRLPAFSEQQVPEPATVLVWSVLAGGVALRFRRRSAGKG